MAFSKWYRDKINKGLCVTCGKRKSIPSKRRCKKCLEENRQVYWIKRSTGLCAACGRPTKSGIWRCRRCADRGNALALGLLPDEYSAALRRAKGHCFICKKKVSRLAVDHDHSNGTVREALCCHCNHMLGSAKDNPEILLAGARYLKRFRKRDYEG